MKRSFYKNSLTRRNLIQIAYQEHFETHDISYYLNNYEFLLSEIDQGLYSIILNKIFDIDYDYLNILMKANIDKKGLSLICLSILKIAIAEFLLGLVEKKLLIAEYIKISKSFLEDYEVKILNKILEDVFSSLKSID